MRYIQTNQFREAFAKLPQHIQQRAKKQLALFFYDYRYPSLQTKKMEGHNDLSDRDYGVGPNTLRYIGANA